MIFVPRDASNEQLLSIVRDWVDVLSNEQYAAVFEALGYSVAFDRPGADCIRDEIKRYRSSKYFPDTEDFTVTNWRTARGGNPSPIAHVTRYKPNRPRLVGAIDFDLPLNGRWSDLTANFVLFENDDTAQGFILALEDITPPLSEWNERAT
jgi:hypothetical protein